MPSASDELRAAWGGDDHDAIAYLRAQGYTLLPSWDWKKPNPDHKPTDRENIALDYLFFEWDFGDCVP